MRLAIPILVLTALAACTTTPVSVDFDETVNFATYRTFDWWAAPGADQAVADLPSTLFDRRARREIARVLAANGMAKDDAPDLRILPRLRTREVREISAWDYGPRWRSRGRGYVAIRDYVEGTIVLDVIDARQNALVWRGVTRISLDATGPTEESVREAVEALLARFPPGSQ